MRRQVLAASTMGSIVIAIGLVLASNAKAEDLPQRCQMLLSFVEEAMADSDDPAMVARASHLGATGEAYCESGYFSQGIVVLTDALGVLDPPAKPRELETRG